MRTTESSNALGRHGWARHTCGSNCFNTRDILEELSIDIDGYATTTIPVEGLCG
jgi:hypothetical protein